MWDGTRWSITPSANPGGGGSALFGVSCISSTDCVAAGATTAGHRHQRQGDGAERSDDRQNQGGHRWRQGRERHELHGHLVAEHAVGPRIALSPGEPSPKLVVPSGSCDITGAIAAVGPQGGVGGRGDRQAASPGWSPRVTPHTKGSAPRSQLLRSATSASPPKSNRGATDRRVQDAVAARGPSDAASLNQHDKRQRWSETANVLLVRSCERPPRSPTTR